MVQVISLEFILKQTHSWLSDIYRMSNEPYTLFHLNNIIKRFSKKWKVLYFFVSVYLLIHKDS